MAFLAGIVVGIVAAVIGEAKKGLVTRLLARLP